MPASDRSKRAKFDTDLCRLGDRYFIRCILYVPFNFGDDAFGWGVWAEVSAETFSRYRKMFNKDGSNEPSHAGRLANALKFYPDANEEAVTVKFKNAASRPTPETLAASASSLAIEQHNGIDLARYHDILRGIGAL